MTSLPPTKRRSEAPPTFWRVPVLDDPIAQREANLLFSVLRAQAGGLISLSALIGVLALGGEVPQPGFTIAILLTSTLPIFAAMGLAHRGRLQWGSYFAIFTALMSTTGTAFLVGGLRSSIVLTLVFGPLVASVLRGRKALLIVGGLTLALMGVNAGLEAQGITPLVVPPDARGSILAAYVTAAGTLCLFMAVLYIYSREVDRAGQRAMASEKHLADLVRESPDGIAVVDEDGYLISINNALSAMSGFAPDDFIGKHLLEVPGAESQETKEKLEKGLPRAGREASLVELTLNRKDGTPYVVEANPRAISLPDGWSIMLVVIRDITARVEAEKKQRSLELDLQDARRMEGLGRLAGGLAHDLRNMLTPILMNAGELREESNLGETALTMVDEIEASSTRASELLSQVLTFARRQRLNFTIVDINKELRDLEPMLRRLIRSNISVALELKQDLRPIRADKGQLGQVVVNLAANARDAMPAGGSLTIETRNVKLSQEYADEHPGVNPGAYSCIIVSDTGEGMSEQVRKHVFDPFFTTKGSEEGVGLGLATVHGIIAQSGGTIHVYSEPGHGASFRIYLPSVDTDVVPESTGQRPRLSEAGNPENYQLLLVDDEELVRLPLVRALKRTGLNVIEAGSGKEALQRANEFPGKIDLLVTDVVMPELGGPELAEQLAESRPDMKVLFLSGYTDVGMVRSGTLGQDARLLSKPFVASELIEKVREILLSN